MTLESWNIDSGMTPLDTVIKPLTEAVRVGTATFNAFGITARNSTREAPDHVADQFIDDLTYTVVPEPATTTMLLVLGGLAVFNACRRTRER